MDPGDVRQKSLAVAVAALMAGGFISTISRAAGSPPADEATAPCSGQWDLVESPQPGTYNVFTDVAALAADDVWAVGHYFTGVSYVALVAHWTGSGWELVPPEIDLEDIALKGVAFSSPTDGWAVGSFHVGVNLVTLTLRWDGIAWTQVESPTLGSAELQDVVVLGSSDAWAVGGWFDGVRSRTLTEHWDGAAWTIVPSVDPAEDNNLLGVAGTSSADLWAVGYSGDVGREHPFIEHWDGVAWSLAYYSPSKHARFSDVDTVSLTDAWAVGWDAVRNAGLVMRWDGIRWRAMRSPRPGSGSILQGVDALSPAQAWAVGDFAEAGTGSIQPLVERWDGVRWRVAPSAPSPNDNPQLLGVSASGSRDAWAVGTETGPHGTETLVERRCLLADR
jgi:hypothetical protein